MHSGAMLLFHTAQDALEPNGESFAGRLHLSLCSLVGSNLTVDGAAHSVMVPKPWAMDTLQWSPRCLGRHGHAVSEMTFCVAMTTA